METSTVPPFYPNTDDLHCFEASLRMVLKHFLPEQEYTWEQLDELTGKRAGKWSWPQRAMLALKDMGFEVVDMDTFDYQAFSEQGADYLFSYYKPGVGEEQVKNSDIPNEMEVAKRYAASGIHALKVPGIEDIMSCLAEGYLVICNVNSRTLAGRRGYAGHAVLVYEADENHVTFHDPGLPASPAERAPTYLFLKAFRYGGEDTPNMLAIRKA